MKKSFMHKEAIISKGDNAFSFFIVLNGRVLLMNSSGNSIKKIILKNEIYGLIECLGKIKWKNTIISERKSELLFISSDIFYKNIFSSNKIKSIAMPLIKMINISDFKNA